MRVLGLDYGDRRIGVAVSDPTGIAITGLADITWNGADLDPVLARLSAILADYAEETPVERIVVGLPLTADGSEGPAARKVRGFMEELARRLNLPVDGADERHTTEDARAHLRETGWSGPKKKKKLDVMSAILILRGYLDGKR